MNPLKDKLLKGLEDAIDEYYETQDGRAVRNIWEDVSGMCIDDACDYKLTKSEIGFLISSFNLIAPQMSVPGYDPNDQIN